MGGFTGDPIRDMITRKKNRERIAAMRKAAKGQIRPFQEGRRDLQNTVSNIKDEFLEWYKNQKWENRILPNSVDRSEAGMIADFFEQDIVRLFSCPTFKGKTIKQLIESGISEIDDDDYDAVKMFKLMLLKFSLSSEHMGDAEILEVSHQGKNKVVSGDIYLRMKNEEANLEYGVEFDIFEELKCGGAGTAMNIGADTIFKTGIIQNEDFKSFSEFLKEKQHKENIMKSYIEIYGKNKVFTELLEKEGIKQSVLEKVSRIARGAIGYSKGNVEKFIEDNYSTFNQEEKEIANVIKSIIHQSNENKREYLGTMIKKYTEDGLKQERAKKMVLALLEGSMVGEKGLNMVTDDNINKRDISVRGYDKSIFIKDSDGQIKLYRYDGLLKTIHSLRSSKSKIILDYDEENSGGGFSIKIEENGVITPLLGMQLNWRNVFQGIATPSFNVFMKFDLKEVSESQWD